MTKTIQLTVMLKLELASEIERDYFYGNLSNTLRSGLGKVLVDDPTAVQVVACDDPEQTLSHFRDLRPLLESSQEIAIIWSVDDVLEVRSDLTRERALEVLQSAEDNHDAGIGIDWNTLEYIANDLFGFQEE